MKKLISIILGLILSVSSLALFACGGGGSSGGTNEIVIASCGASRNGEWGKQAAARYMAIHPEINVKVYDYPSNTKLINATDSHDIIFEDNIDVLSYSLSGMLADLTDFWTRPSKYSSAPLKDRVIPEAIHNFKCGDKYYAVPHSEYYPGLSYNKVLFDENGLYFANADAANKEWYDGDFGGADFVSENFTAADLSAGPNRKAGDYDDGLPATLQEFVILCDYMMQKGITPLQFTGQNPEYVNAMLNGLWASLAGQEAMNAYKNFTGKVEVVKTKAQTDNNDFNSIVMSSSNLISGAFNNAEKKPETEWVDINDENGYLVHEMAAKYYAIAFVETCREQGFFSDGSIKSKTMSHTDAQAGLLNSSVSGASEKIGMLVEQTYWWHETNVEGKLDIYEKASGKSSKDLDIRFMPLPTALNEEEYQKNKDSRNFDSTLVDSGNCAAVVLKQVQNGDPEHFEVVLDFLDFLYSEEELQSYTADTGMARPFKYDMPQETLNEMSIFTRELWKLREQSKVIYYTSSNPIVKNSSARYYIGTWGGTWLIKSSYFTTDNLEKLTVMEMFNEKRMSSQAWDAERQGN